MTAMNGPRPAHWPAPLPVRQVSDATVVSVRFRIAYYTEWGQKVKIFGRGSTLLGDGDVQHGCTMTCFHPQDKKDQLVWEALIPCRPGQDLTYKYAVLGGDNRVVHMEQEYRTVNLPDRLRDGDYVELHDRWMAPGQPDAILHRAAFAEVIHRVDVTDAADVSPRQHAEATARALASLRESRLSPASTEVLVKLRVYSLRLEPGQKLCVVGSINALGSWSTSDALDMRYTGKRYWEAEFPVAVSLFPFSYRYALYSPGGQRTMEHGDARVCVLDPAKPPSGSAQAALASSLPDDLGARRSKDEAARAAAPPPSSPGRTMHVRAAKAPVLVVVNDGHVRYQDNWKGAGICVPVFSLRSETSAGCGDFEDVKKLVDLAVRCGMKLIQLLPVNDTQVHNDWRDSYPYSCTSVYALHPLYLSIEVLMRNVDSHAGRTQPSQLGGLGHQLFSAAGERSSGSVGGLARSSAGNPGNSQGARSDGSGDDDALKDTCAPAGGRLSQADLVRLKAQVDNEVKRLRRDLGEQSSPRPDMDYERTAREKQRVARLVFDACGNGTMTSPGFRTWFQANAHWVRPYAAFCLLKELFGTAEHWKWGELAKPSAEVINRLTASDTPHYHGVAFTFWLQYHLHLQLEETSQYAKQHRVALKGDLPIGIDKRSVEAWLEPRLFRMDVSLGAPPDYFNPMGQNWGFPVYDWVAMARDDFAWWRRRLHHMAQYFHAYRIDHILGFFHIWELDGDNVTGMLGHFRPAHTLSPRELDQLGIASSPEDLARLLDPYITDEILDDVMDGDAALVAEAKAKYLDGPDPKTHRYRLRPNFSSEKAICTVTDGLEGAPPALVDRQMALMNGLLQLRQNVVLVRDTRHRERLHPRFQLRHSSSFAELEAPVQRALVELHDDYFHNRHLDLWTQSAQETLPHLLQCSDMLVFGEDLGFVPTCVTPVMRSLGIIGLRIQRMPPPVEQPEGTQFSDLSRHPYLSVASPSCHDVAPLRLWWESDPRRTARFAFEMLRVPDPSEKCTAEMAGLVLQHHFNCPSVFTVLLLQDLLALSDDLNTRPAAQETINNPAVFPWYWRYRMHVTLEELIAHKEFPATVRGMLASSGRTGGGGFEKPRGPSYVVGESINIVPCGRRSHTGVCLFSSTPPRFVSLAHDTHDTGSATSSAAGSHRIESHLDGMQAQGAQASTWRNPWPREGEADGGAHGIKSPVDDLRKRRSIDMQNKTRMGAGSRAEAAGLTRLSTYSEGGQTAPEGRVRAGSGGPPGRQHK
ncbi:unnamed protein product [Pedinophyceae sp. YPF-701]|nr:unnamed protein product [Pedinophyceae sp. YPF-701]